MTDSLYPTGFQPDPVITHPASKNTDKKPGRLDPLTSRVIACATVIEEMLPYLPPQISHTVLDFGLHNNTEALTVALQNELNATLPHIKTVLLGYGLCSQAVVGLKSDRCTLVIPRVDDCIAIFLGSTHTYQEQYRQVPGTYYLTKGWMEAGYSPMNEFDVLVNQYGEEKARYIISKMLKHYTRLALINTHNYEMQVYRERSIKMAEQFGLNFEEIEGSDSMIKKFFSGHWDEEFVVIEPGRNISFMDFRNHESPSSVNGP
jgi:hypothetical protein